MPHSISQFASSTERAARTLQLDKQVRLLWIPGRRTKIAAESLDLGQACRDNGEVALAESNLERVIHLLKEGQPNKSKESLKIFALLAASYNHLGLLRLDQGQHQNAGPFFDQAIEIRRKLLRLFPNDRENQVYLGGALCNRAHAVADMDRVAAIGFYQECLSVLRQPIQTCECSYWDEVRQSWWCEQLEALGDALRLQWVSLAPEFIDNAMKGLESVEPPSTEQTRS